MTELAGNIVLELFLVSIAVITLAWGFERYRSRFVKLDLIVALVFGVGLLVLTFSPAIFSRLATLVNLEKRYVLVSILSNTAMLLLVLYLLTKVRDARNEISQLTREFSLSLSPESDDWSETINVVIPAYNEEKSIGGVIDSLPKSIHGYDVVPIIVSDGSIDETAKRANRPDTIVVEHPINQGQGGALKTGFDVAMSNNAAIVVTMDADGQHPADELEKIVAPIIENEADYVLGSRYRGTNTSENSVVRRSGIHVFTWLINVLTKLEITDCTNGFRAIRGSELENITLTEERFSAPELIIEARKAGLRIQEVPITIKQRYAGTSKKPKLGYAVGLARTIFTAWLR